MANIKLKGEATRKDLTLTAGGGYHIEREGDHNGNVLYSWLAARSQLCYSRACGFSGAHQITIAIEAGIKNPVLAVVVASVFIGSAEYAVPAAVYPVVMLSVSLVFIISAQILSVQPARVGQLNVE